MRQRLPIIATALLVVSCTSSSSTLPPLLVMTDDDAVTAISVAGEAVELVAADPDRLVSQATWSPDGRLAVWTELDTSTGTGMIAMGNEEGQRRIDGGTTPFFYSWSPDGEHVAYLGNSPDQIGVALGLIDVSPGTARLVDVGAPYYLDWAPDGSRLAVHIDTTFIGFVDLEGTRTGFEATPGLFQAPQFLADGRLLVATGGASQGVALSDGTGEPVLIAPTAGGTFFDASPDGSMLAFTDTSKGGVLGDLSVMPIDGADSQQISAGPVVAFEWSPSGEMLLLLTVNADGSALIPQIWTAEGVRDYEEVLPTRSMIDQYLPYWDQYIRVLTLWAQDGASFVMPVASEAGGSIIVYDVETGETTRVTDGRFASWSPAS